ncbi:MAG: phospholipase D family protein [Saprospiraceae bacterium]
MAKIRTFLCSILYFGMIISCKEPADQKPSSNKDFCASIHKSEPISIRQALAGLDTILTKKSGAYVLEDGDGSMIARAWMTEHATKSIDIQYFIFSVDNVGLIACDYLVRAADRGVKVRILVDDIMVEADPSDIMIMDAHPNIDIKIYNPGMSIGKNIFQKIGKLMTDFRGSNQRMHNKTFIADRAAAITGGRNIADEYFDYDHQYNFRDRDIFLLGPIVHDIQTSFDTFWNDKLSVPISTILKDQVVKKDDPYRYEKLHQYACDSSNYWPQIRERVSRVPLAFKDMVDSGSLIWTDSIKYVSDDPGKNDGSQGLLGSGKSTEALIDLIKGAQSTIDIQSPYLVTTELSRDLFINATKRGVKISILTNSLASTDNLEAFSGYQRDRKKLLDTGIQIYEFRPDAACRFALMTGDLSRKLDYTPIFGLHAKTMVVDGHTLVIGTFNLDPRSAHLNTECITIINNKTLAKGVLKGMEEEFQPENSWHTTRDWNPDHLVKKSKRAGVFVRKIVPKGIL